MYRYTENHVRYMQQIEGSGDACPFCALGDKKLNPGERRIIEETEHALVVESLYPYDIWEDFKVAEHLMILPKKHVAALDVLTPGERAEIMDLFCKYGSNGYDLYNRAPSNTMRSVAHVHVHLFKTFGDHAKHIEITRQPYDLTIEW